MGKQIITTTPSPNSAGQPQVKLRKSDFDALIWDKGYPVYHDKAIRCPCKEEPSDNLSTCRNCGGSGWLFINRSQTKMVVQSMNQDTQFKEWSDENRGTARISAMSEDKLSFMDRITLYESESIYNEVLYPKLYNGNNFAFTMYEVVEVLDIFLFQGANRKLKVLELDVDYTISSNKIILNSLYASGVSKISIRYIHRPQFHIIDVMRNIMDSEIFDPSTLSGKRSVPFPISAIGKIAHYTLDPINYDGDYLFDNSYKINSYSI